MKCVYCLHPEHDGQCSVYLVPGTRCGCVRPTGHQGPWTPPADALPANATEVPSDRFAYCKGCANGYKDPNTHTCKPASPGHPVFLKLLAKMKDTHIRKGADYSKPEDILSNLRACERFGVPSHKGILVRMSDKWERIQNLIMKEDQGEGPAVVDESLEDTLEDLANYALLMITVRRERVK